MDKPFFCLREKYDELTNLFHTIPVSLACLWLAWHRWLELCPEGLLGCQQLSIHEKSAWGHDPYTAALHAEFFPYSTLCAMKSRQHYELN